MTMADDNKRTIRRIKLLGLKTYGEGTEVELPKDADLREAGFFEGIFNVWVDVPVDGENETVKLRLLNSGGDYDPDEFELLRLGVRPNGHPVGLLKAK